MQNSLTIPDEILRREARKAALQKARAEIEARVHARSAAELAEHEQKLAARAAQAARGEPVRGQAPAAPSPEPAAKDQYNFTDPESRIMKAGNDRVSLSAWVWADARPDWASILCGDSGVDGVGQFSANPYPTSDGFVAYVQSSARTQIGVREGVALPTNQWQHVAMVADGSLLRIYCNGAQVGTAPYGGTLFSPTNALSISVTLSTDDTGPNLTTPGYWEGKLDDVAYWTRNLSASDVFALFAAGLAGQPVTTADAYLNTPPIITSPPPAATVYRHEPCTLSGTAASPAPPTYQWWQDGTLLANATNRTYTNPRAEFPAAGSYKVVVTAKSLSVTSSPAASTISAPTPQPDGRLVLYLKLDETSGATAADATTNANTGYLLNFLNPDANWVLGLFGRALAFNQGAPSADAVSVPAQPYLDFGTNAFSLSLWAKGPAGQTDSGSLLCKGNSPGESYCLDYNNGSYRFFVRNSLGLNVANLAISSGVAANNQWQHLAVIYDPTAGQIRMYVNGNLVGTAVTAASAYSNLDTLDIGARQAGSGYAYSWTGLLDDVRVYGRAITPLEVRALTYNGIPPTIAIVAGGTQVVVGWPLEAVGYELQSGTNLVSGSWTLVPGVTTNSVSLTPVGTQQYYRLHRK